MVLPSRGIGARVVAGIPCTVNARSFSLIFTERRDTPSPSNSFVSVTTIYSSHPSQHNWNTLYTHTHHAHSLPHTHTSYTLTPPPNTHTHTAQTHTNTLCSHTNIPHSLYSHTQCTYVLQGPAGVDARFDLAVLVHAKKRFHGVADQLLLVRHVTKVVPADRLGIKVNTSFTETCMCLVFESFL